MFFMQTWAATELGKAPEGVKPCQLGGLTDGYSVQAQCVMDAWEALQKPTEVLHGSGQT